MSSNPDRDLKDDRPSFAERLARVNAERRAKASTAQTPDYAALELLRVICLIGACIVPVVGLIVAALYATNEFPFLIGLAVGVLLLLISAWTKLAMDKAKHAKQAAEELKEVRLLLTQQLSTLSRGRLVKRREHEGLMSRGMPSGQCNKTAPMTFQNSRVKTSSKSHQVFRTESTPMKRRELIAWILVAGCLALACAFAMLRPNAEAAPIAESPKGNAFWLSRAGEPATDVTILSIDEPLIQNDGRIDLPAGNITVSTADEAPPKPKARVGFRGAGRRSATKDRDKQTKQATANRWAPADPWLVDMLVGRSLQRGERALIHASDVTFYPPTPTDKLHVPVTQ